MRLPRAPHLATLRRAGAPPADGTPFGYTTPDTARVVYRGGGRIYELWYRPPGSWAYGDLTQITSARGAKGDPYGYHNTYDQSARVVYLGFDDHVDELHLPPAGAWSWTDLTP